MTEAELQYCTVEELAWRISCTKADPRFAFFLGSGMSWQSGIPTGQEMTAEFRRELNNRWKKSGTPDEFDVWLARQRGWAEGASEYSN